MITKEKIEIYKYFKGDIDGWARSGTKKQQIAMNDEDWFLIDSLIQDIRVLKKGLASDAYIKSTNERLQEDCDNEATIQMLKNIA